MGKKISVTVEVLTDGSFAIEFSRGTFDKVHGSSESIDGVVAKVGLYLKRELGAKAT